MLNETNGIVRDMSKCECIRYTIVTKNHESKA